MQQGDSVPDRIIIIIIIIIIIDCMIKIFAREDRLQEIWLAWYSVEYQLIGSGLLRVHAFVEFSLFERNIVVVTLLMQ